MGDHRRDSGSYPHELAKVRVARIARRQQNRIASHQLMRLGLGGSTVRDWTRAGYLHPRLRGVHAVGSSTRTTESDLFEAVLYAGPNAALSHMTAAWWLGLIDHPSPLIHVSTPRRRTQARGIIIHKRRQVERIIQRGIPSTSVAQTVLDLAAAGELTLVRRALARLDHQHRLDLESLLALCQRGRHGSSTVRWAIANYDPRFAHTRSPLEDNWLVVCERYDIPKPDDVNVEIYGIPVDAVYYDAMLIIELDGIDNHRSPAQIRRDHRNDFTLRSHHWMVLRYTSDQVRDDAADVVAEVLSELPRAPAWVASARHSSDEPTGRLPPAPKISTCHAFCRRPDSAVGADPHQTVGPRPDPARGQRPPPPRRAPRVGAEHEQPGAALADELEQRGDRPAAGDPQQLGGDPQRRGAAGGLADRVEILLVRERGVLTRQHQRRRVRRQPDQVGQQQPGAGLERRLDRHPLGDRVDPDRQRRQHDRPCRESAAHGPLGAKRWLIGCRHLF
jgi:Protein of unknown function (DUF559)